MKSMKKIMSVLLTAAMVCASTFPAFATSTGDGTQAPAKDDSTATVVVGTGNAGDELSAYPVIDATFDADSNNLTYEFSDVFNRFREVTKLYKDLTVEQYCEYVDSANASADKDFRALLGDFSAYIKTSKDNPVAPYKATTEDNGIATFTAIPMGQYIILGSGNTNGAYVYQTVTAEVIPVANPKDNNFLIYPSYNVTMKTTEPTADKTIDGTTVTPDGENNTASIGDSVSFTLSATVPTYSKGATNTTFYMGDTLSEGLSWDTTKELVVKGLNGDESTILTKDTDYAVFTVGQKLYIHFNYANIKGYTKVTADYAAIVNEKALIGTTGNGNVNTYDLIYSNDPFNGSTFEPTPEEPEVPENPEKPGEPAPGYGHKDDIETVYTYALLINKYEEGTETTKLAGATFEVYTTYENGDWSGLVGTITTDANGYAALEGLKAGVYHLKETVAPAGYKLKTTDTEIDIKEANVTSTVMITSTDIEYTAVIDEAKIKSQAKDDEGNLLYLTSEGSVVTEAEGNSAAYVKSYTVTVDKDTVTNGGAVGSGYLNEGISNVQGSSLPSTGGVGTTIFYVIGGLLMLFAAIVFVTRKRMEGKSAR